MLLWISTLLIYAMHDQIEIMEYGYSRNIGFLKGKKPSTN